jgi:hypothetical protein
MIKNLGGRWNPRLLEGGAGWTFPRSREVELKNLIETLKQDKQLSEMKNHAKSRRGQHKYHRAISEDESESDVEEEKETNEEEKQNEDEISNESDESDESNESEEIGIDRGFEKPKKKKKKQERQERQEPKKKKQHHQIDKKPKT